MLSNCKADKGKSGRALRVTIQLIALILWYSEAAHPNPDGQPSFLKMYFKIGLSIQGNHSPRTFQDNTDQVQCQRTLSTRLCLFLDSQSLNKQIKALLIMDADSTKSK